MIVSFWKCHNGIVPEGDDGMDDLKAWTAEGHKLYFIVKEEKKVGFCTSRKPRSKSGLAGRHFCSPGISESRYRFNSHQTYGRDCQTIFRRIFIEAASRNLDAIRLYRKLGFDCLNTITVCKDLKKYQYDVIKEEKVCGCDFEIRKYKL